MKNKPLTIDLTDWDKYVKNKKPPMTVGIHVLNEYFRCLCDYIKENPGKTREQLKNIMYDFNLSEKDKLIILSSVECSNRIYEKDGKYYSKV